MDDKLLREEIKRLRAETDSLREHLSRADEEHQRNHYRLCFLSDYIYSVKVENGEAVETRHGLGCFAVTGYHSDDYGDDPKLW